MYIRKIMGILVLFLVIGVSVGSAETTYLHISKYVSDFAGVLSDQEEADLNDLCESVEKNTTVEIAVVTVHNTGMQDVVQFAAKIGEENGVGNKETDNGIVLLLSFENEGGFAIATGRGAESVITDYKASELARGVESDLNKGRYYESFRTVIMNIEKATQSNTYARPTTPSVGSNPLIGIIAVVACILVIKRRE